jgi:hypothetical protein
VGDIEKPRQHPYRASKSFLPAVSFGKNWKIKQRSTHGQDFGGCLAPNSAVEEAEVTISQALDEKQTQPRLNKFDGTLYVKGFKLYTIASLSGCVLNGVIPREAFEFGGWPKKSKDTKYPDDTPECLWRTLVADRGPDGTNAPTWYRRACRECFNHINMNGDLNTALLTTLGDAPRTMKAFPKRVREVVWHRKFFLTAGDETRVRSPRYGLAPSRAEVNDIICIFFGCNVPVVLRKSMEQPGMYQLIGECYVHGIMNGESLLYTGMITYPYDNVKDFILI